jgi:hypothetical protein
MAHRPTGQQPAHLIGHLAGDGRRSTLRGGQSRSAGHEGEKDQNDENPPLRHMGTLMQHDETLQAIVLLEGTRLVCRRCDRESTGSQSGGDA